MKGRGSITVFLSLILVLLFSFLMTMLEAARICGASAYTAMISELAGDSLLASYYYPLFQEYRLFGVDAGNENGFFSVEKIETKLEENAEYGMSGLQGGLLSFDNTQVFLQEYQTLMSEEGREFLDQIREQVVLDGLSLGITDYFRAEQFSEAGAVGQIVMQQEEALAETATVTKEILKLMELVDGIGTGKQGLTLDKNGRLKTKEVFVKQLVPMNSSELKSLYENEELYMAVSGNFFRADKAAEAVLDDIQDAEWLAKEIASLEAVLYRGEEEDPEKKEEWKLQIAEYEEEREAELDAARAKYRELMNRTEEVEPLLEKSLEILEELEQKQKKAQASVASYELFLRGMEASVSKEIYDVFSAELETMKFYAGMEEQGYYVPVMKQSLENNLSILQGLALEGFSWSELGRIEAEMARVIREMENYSVEGLWFTYGELTLAEETGANVLDAVGELLLTGVLELVGIEKEQQSGNKLNGEALPSAVLEEEHLLTDLMGCISTVQQLFSEGGVGAVLGVAGNSLLDAAALELYCMKYFHTFVEPSETTKLKYEREYLLFGATKDKANLLCVVLHLVAMRTLFSMAGIMKNPDRMAAIEAFAAGVAGCTGIPILLALLRYGIVFLWAVEEALVEVAALLQGKRLPVIGTGCISIDELLFINKSQIVSKAKSLPEGTGPGYTDYLTLLSLTKSAKKKMYRAMDLIQENLRCRYRDSFRLRNVVTRAEFRVSAGLDQRYDTGWFPERIYQLEWEENCTY